ncbi:MAG TPA: hypothetical protein VK504_15670 [Vicinamibacterales bacterium]|jgi:hypothetical protein|nr:hypothetical protein [Vicinamibacterales bacterium]
MQPLIAGVAAPPDYLSVRGETRADPLTANCINFGLTAQRGCLAAVNEP